MSTEINTRGMIRSKISSFPVGNDNECLSKSEITTTEKALVHGSYGDNECPVIDDVVRAEIRPLQSEITIKRGNTGIVSLSGYLQEITLLRLSANNASMNINKVLKPGEYEQTLFAKITFNGNSISFLVAAIAPKGKAEYTFDIDGKEQVITVTIIS